MDTQMPRDLRIWPMDATVMPLPTDDTTPPVTKMYLASLIRLLSLRLQDYHHRLWRQRGFGDAQLRLRRNRRLPDFVTELLQRRARRAQRAELVVHGHDVARLQQVDHLDS